MAKCYSLLFEGSIFKIGTWFENTSTYLISYKNSGFEAHSQQVTENVVNVEIAVVRYCKRMCTLY